MLGWIVVAGGMITGGVLPLDEPSTNPASLQQLFADAGTAFDQGRYPDAAAHYNELLALQVISPEIWFNLGNTYYRMNDMGQAVLAFRRAWGIMPRDSDIQTNMHLAMQKTSAVMRQASSIDQLLLLLSLKEWHGLATSLWWGLWSIFGLGAIAPKTRAISIRLGCILVVAFIAALYAIHQWSNRFGTKEYVVTSRGLQALYGPLEDAEPYFSLPAGSILTLEEIARPWVKISIADRKGWVQEDAISPVISKGEKGRVQL